MGLFSFKLSLVYLFVIAFFSCNNNSTDTKELSNSSASLGYSIEKVADCFIIRLKDAFPNSGEKESYCLCPKGKSLEGNYSQFIEIPVKRVGISSTTHLGFLNIINQIASIKAASNLNLYYHNDFNSYVEKGMISSIGFGEIEAELLVDKELDVLFTYAIDAASYSKVERLRSLGQKVVLVSEFMEQNPLDKAKWLEFFSMFYGKNEQKIAKEYLKEIEQKYAAIKKKTNKLATKPKVMLGMPWKGNWYISGANTYQATFIKDAGADYQWKELVNEISTPIAFEKVLLNSIDAAYWLNPGSYKSRKEIIEVDQRFENIAAFQNKSIYSHYKRTNSNGANDYWESGVVEPHIILADLTYILHPEVLKNHQLKYYFRVDE